MFCESTNRYSHNIVTVSESDISFCPHQPALNCVVSMSSDSSGQVVGSDAEVLVLSSQGTQPSDGVVITKPGNLPTKHIIHMVGRTKEADITSSMLKTLMMCESHKLQSVSFPALGTAVIQPPRTWTRMVNKDMEMIDLAPASGEYKKLSSLCQCFQIQRIQNKYLWQRYAVKKQILDKKYPTNKNELNLYHGTTADICHKINSTGFNRSFCGRNATVYGNGTYFAKESWYSCQDTYSNPDVSGLKYMYRARVLVGKPCKGLQGMKEPSPLSASNPQAGLHDSAVDDLQKPFIYVVFCDAGAYPEYLISFKTK
uniref:Poly [ADP-ribose] polymerase n=1 Tax=Myripristis murdjan TaxID=586833 RepID=A0A667Y0K8_9TELE